MKGKLMKHYQLARESNQYYLDMKYPYFDNRIDCLYIKRYYEINDNTFDMITIFQPTLYGLQTIKQMKGFNTMDLKAKLAAKLGNGKIDINASNGNLSLKDKLNQSNKNIINQSAINKADMTANKFAEVEALRQSIKDHGVDIINLQNDISQLTKVVMESNAFCATLAKDQKSILNAINALHGKLASNKIAGNGNADQNQKVITKKADNKGITSNILSIADQNLDNDSYQGLYEHFKTYFNHKFAKSSNADMLPEFKLFINGIDWNNLQSIDDSCRSIWQAYRADNGGMLFAPNSMKLAIESLNKLGNDFDLIKDSNIESPDNVKVNSEVKDFNYWSQLLNVDIAIIKECVSCLKDSNIKDDSTKQLLIEYIQESSNGYEMQDINEFIKYLETSNFAG